ncbi:Vitamin K epoxide reductase complex subunit 1 [Eumeta japonica]|uniref:vitamin-K-epoxide reductase (warfarin-sensitive) n=1 Tax=Eumeta variegata TaxID=151549 RepID=A0A4C1Z4W3_EUMVA|nr:Vitamin K epoxide reductase complex subunit 1 [Eumeta japonica]
MLNREILLLAKVDDGAAEKVPHRKRAGGRRLCNMASNLNRSIITTCIIGVLASTYALYVEMAAEARPGYKAMCDLSDHMSCSRVLTSEYSKGFGIIPHGSAFEVPNCIYGIIFYCLLIFLTTYEDKRIVQLQFFLALGSLATSVYLAYLLMFVLHDLCVVCVSTFIINVQRQSKIISKVNRLGVLNISKYIAVVSQTQRFFRAASFLDRAAGGGRRRSDDGAAV